MTDSSSLSSYQSVWAELETSALEVVADILILRSLIGGGENGRRIDALEQSIETGIELFK